MSSKKFRSHVESTAQSPDKIPKRPFQALMVWKNVVHKTIHFMDAKFN